MRTTLTLDPDVAQKVKARAAQEKSTFKEVVNRALRRGLSVPEKHPKKFRVVADSLGIRPGIDLHKLNQLVDELETQDFARKLARSGKRTGE